MKKYTYVNRDKTTLTFMVLEEQKVIILNGFQNNLGFEGDPNSPISVDPSGGPYISIGMDINQFILPVEERSTCINAREITKIEFIPQNIILHFVDIPNRGLTINKKQTKTYGKPNS